MPKFPQESDGRNIFINLQESGRSIGTELVQLIRALGQRLSEGKRQSETAKVNDEGVNEANKEQSESQ